jgi:hypothetical protein
MQSQKSSAAKMSISVSIYHLVVVVIQALANDTYGFVNCNLLPCELQQLLFDMKLYIQMKWNP